MRKENLKLLQCNLTLLLPSSTPAPFQMAECGAICVSRHSFLPVSSACLHAPRPDCHSPGRQKKNNKTKPTNQSLLSSNSKDQSFCVQSIQGCPGRDFRPGGAFAFFRSLCKSACASEFQMRRRDFVTQTLGCQDAVRIFIHFPAPSGPFHAVMTWARRKNSTDVGTFVLFYSPSLTVLSVLFFIYSTPPVPPPRTPFPFCL